MTATLSYAPDPALSFWPTPDRLADDLVYRAMIPGYGDGSAAGGCPQIRVLEPSAGDGHIIRALRKYLPYAHVTAVEPSAERAAGLRAQDGLADDVHECTLEDYLTGVAVQALAGTFQPYDLVLMNPPFTLAGRPEAWAEHVLAIFNDPHLLLPYGCVSAVVPRIVVTGKSKLVRAVRALLHPHYGIDLCERGAFDPVGAKVSAATIFIQRNEEGGPYVGD